VVTSGELMPLTFVYPGARWIMIHHCVVSSKEVPFGTYLPVDNHYNALSTAQLA